MEQCTLAVRLKPQARREEVRFTSPDDPLQVGVNAPPLENRANKRCIALLAKRLRVRESALRIIRGGHCRDKVIACSALTREEAIRRLVAEQ